MTIEELIKRYRDQIPGGRGDHLDPEDFDLETLKKGIKVEMEHTTDPMLALEITLDHLAENPDYYELLETIDPHDEEPHGEEPSSAEGPIKRRKNEKTREFITGDEVVQLMGEVAAELDLRGNEALAEEVKKLLSQLR